MINSNRYIIFSIDTCNFAISVNVVERVIHAVEITLIPDSPVIMAGIMNMEGEIISVISMRRSFNIPDREITLNDRFIVVQSERQKLALIVDSVSDILNLSENDIVKSDIIFDGLSKTTGAIRREDGVIPILDINQLFITGDENAELLLFVE